MNIALFLLDITDRGGVERMAALLANQLSTKYKVIIISLKKNNNVPFFYVNNNVSIIYINCTGGIARKALATREILVHHKINCLINVDTGMALIGIISCLMSRISVITWEHSNFFNNWGSKKFPYVRKFAARYSTALVTLTEMDKKNYLQNIRGCVPVYVIPNPIEHGEYQYCQESRIIMSAGQLLPIKQFDLLIDVADKVLHSHPSWKWIICGDGPEKDKLKKKIACLGLDNCVELVGAVPNIHDYYNKASVFVLTSKMEGLPMVLLEAKAHKLPIVSFDIMTGPSEIIQNGINGFLVPSNNIDLMAYRINELIDNPGLRLLFSNQASVGIDKFSYETVSLLWERLLEHINEV